MELRNSENIIKIIRRHPTPYIFNLIIIALISFPFYGILCLVDVYDSKEKTEIFFTGLAIVSFFLGIIIAIVSVDYLLDKLIITNKRVIWIDWKSLFKRVEHELEIRDIQDIETREKGILSSFWVFDYGFLEIETSATKPTITFNDCSDPENVKHFIMEQVVRERGWIHEKPIQ